MDRQYTFGFVVLHYGGIETTKECIAKIQYICGANSEIVVVDNCSPDGSGRELQEYYVEQKKVYVLLNSSNLGFARGNNAGYRYLRERRHCDFICVMNNDVMLRQPDMESCVTELYEETGFAVLGPHVTLRGEQENIFDFSLKPVEFYVSEYKRLYGLYRYFSSRLYPERELVNRAIRSVQSIGKKQEPDRKPEVDVSIYRKPHENVLLHGCCLFFSPVYIERFEDCFCPDTFMFKEEELLYLRCRQAGLKTLYSPKLDVLHLEDVSTDTVYKKNREKEIFVCKNQAESLRVLIRAMRPPLFSICIPCYNVEAYIRRCIDSVLEQEFYDCEIVCVDDGSTDHTLEILREYEQKDPRVRVLANGENKKLIYTRKRAINEAKGRYIIQLDSDDSLCRGSLRILKKRLKEHAYPDVLEFQANVILDASDTWKAHVINELKKAKDQMTNQNYCRIHKGELRGSAIMEALIEDKIGQMPWNKAVRTSLLKKTYRYCTLEHVYYKDDVYACCILYSLADRYIGVIDRLYNYSFSTGKSRNMFSEEDFVEMCKTGQIVDALAVFFAEHGRMDADIQRLLGVKLTHWLDVLCHTISENPSLDRECAEQQMRKAYQFPMLEAVDAAGAETWRMKAQAYIDERIQE